MKFLINSYFVLILMISCTCYSSKERDKKNSFDFFDTQIDENCKLYLMYFFEGEYIFRLATSGSCKSLSKERYLSAYENLLTKNLDNIPIKKGKIIIEKDFLFEADSIFKRSIISITNKRLSKVIKSIDEISDRYIIEVQ